MRVDPIILMADNTEESFVESSKEANVLLKYFGKLTEVIDDPGSLALKLISFQLISTTTLQKVHASGNNPSTRVYYLLNDLRSTIVTDPKKFPKLIEVLSPASPALEVIAKLMKKDYDSDYAYGTDQQEGTSGDSQNTSEQKAKSVLVINEQSIFKDYDQMQGKLGRLFFWFEKALIKAEVKPEDLRALIIQCRPHYEDCHAELRSSTEISEILLIVRRKLCSLLNYSILIDIADEFKLAGALDIIRNYEAEEENYRKKLLSSKFAKELKDENDFLSHHPTAENTIILRLRWSSVNPLTVSEFEKIIQDVFGELYSYIHVLKVEPGSILVKMCAPKQVMGAIIAQLTDSTKQLKDSGANQSTIGVSSIRDIVYDVTGSSYYIRH